MQSSGMLHRVALVRTYNLKECISSQLASLLITANVVPSLPILFTLMMEAMHSPKSSVLMRATWHNIPEDGILHS
jgi:hypothetical protein